VSLKSLLPPISEEYTLGNKKREGGGKWGRKSGGCTSAGEKWKSGRDLTTEDIIYNYNVEIGPLPRALCLRLS
jgi:hypothetical protein